MDHGIQSEPVKKVLEGRPNIVDAIKNEEVHLVINTPSGRHPLKDEVAIRQAALHHQVPVITTMTGAKATLEVMTGYLNEPLDVECLQVYHRMLS